MHGSSLIQTVRADNDDDPRSRIHCTREPDATVLLFIDRPARDLPSHIRSPQEDRIDSTYTRVSGFRRYELRRSLPLQGKTILVMSYLFMRLIPMS